MELQGAVLVVILAKVIKDWLRFAGATDTRESGRGGAGYLTKVNTAMMDKSSHLMNIKKFSNIRKVARCMATVCVFLRRLQRKDVRGFITWEMEL